MPSIMQDWTTELGLRHQGVLVSAVRGCDSLPRDNPSKWLTRFYRACVLQSHCGNPAKAASYMVWTDHEAVAQKYLRNFLEAGLDHYPMHWLTHFMFAAEILGYYYPLDPARPLEKGTWVKKFWRDTYNTIVQKLHLNPETRIELDARLNATERDFAQHQGENHETKTYP